MTDIKTEELCKCRKGVLGKVAPIPPWLADGQTWNDYRPGGGHSCTVWLCATCGKVIGTKQEGVVAVRGPKNAAAVSSSGKHDGTSIMTWKRDNQTIQTIEFRPYPRKVPMSHTEPLIFSLWGLLMSKVEIILDPADVQDHEKKSVAKNEGRGIAEALAILMKPFLATADDVVRAAVEKHKNPDYEVPGLGEHLFDPTKNYDGTDRILPKARTGSKAKVEPELDEQKQKFIKHTLVNGTLEAKDMARMFNVSVETIERYR